ncbi:helix-turn-helix domain-containing protein [Enterococcus sp. N249-2]
MLEIGSTLKHLRQQKKWTQKEVAKRIHVTPQTVSKWENNKSYPDLDYLVQLSALFNVSTDTLLGTAKPAFLVRLFLKKSEECSPCQKKLFFLIKKQSKCIFLASATGSAMVNFRHSVYR